jgi:hypothetical protein
VGGEQVDEVGVLLVCPQPGQRSRWQRCSVIVTAITGSSST